MAKHPIFSKLRVFYLDATIGIIVKSKFFIRLIFFRTRFHDFTGMNIRSP